MLPFDPVTLGTAAILVAGGGNQLCQIPKPAQINVVPKSAPVKYDYSQSLAQLQQHNVDTINPYGYGAKTHTNGFMRGQISMSAQVKLDHKILPRYNAACVWYEDVTLSIEITPEIVIASEVAADRCQHAAVKEHELKHVTVDRKIVNKYARTMGQKVYDGLKQRGFIAGPVPLEHAQDTINRMQQTVMQLVELEQKKMEIERAEAQQAVDSLEEYTRVSNECESFKHKHSSASRRR
ncbi:MAG: hypothetical protein ACRBCT_04685 [Alphaproteobacteria bacterium]